MKQYPFVRVNAPGGKAIGYIIRENGCWEWRGAISTGGYGQWHRPGMVGSAAHRHMYTLLRGPITLGETLDHLCRNTLCVNPDHLEMCSLRENILRGEGVAAKKARQTHCIHGHEFTEENTIHRPDRPRGRGRQCRQCYRDSAARTRAKKCQAPPSQE